MYYIMESSQYHYKQRPFTFTTQLILVINTSENYERGINFETFHISQLTG